MNDGWLTRDEMAKRMGWSVRVVELKAQSGEIWWRPTGSRFRNGKEVREFCVAPQSPDLQTPEADAAAYCPASLEALPPGPKVAFSSLLEEQQARERFRIIKPLIDREHQAAAASGGLSKSELVKRLSKRHGVSEGKIWRWYDLYKKEGILGLARKPRNDKDKSRFFQAYPKAATLAAYVYLEQRQSIRSAFEAIHRDCLQLGLHTHQLPSYETVRAFLKGGELSEPMRLMAREGKRSYRESCAPYVSRGYTDVAANEIWVSDHMIHDVEVQNDCFDDAPIGTPIRLRFTALLDFRSRFVVGVSWAWEGSSRSIATALRHAVTVHGPAEMLYCDNGKDYLKVAKGALPGYLRESEEAAAEWYAAELAQIEEIGLLSRLGMAVQHCIVRHPQSKHVERFFRTLHERFDKKFPTYTGGSPDRRPDFTEAAMAEHRKDQRNLIRMGRPGMSLSLHPSASQFIRMCLAWIDDYHRQPHSGKGMNGRSPFEVFSQEQNPRQKPAPEPQLLALLLAERERRAVRECSVVLNKRRYIGADDIARVILHELNEREVLVAYDPLDLDSVAILDLTGNLITWAQAEKFLPQSPEAGEAIAESMAERRRLEKATRNSILAIGKKARANGARTDVEHLAAHAASLPIAVGDIDEFLTQRKPRFRPDDSATAPKSAAEIAASFLED